MASRMIVLKSIADFNTERLVEFLDVNGLSGYSNVIRIKNVDGATFLNLTELQVNRWKPHVSTVEVRKFWDFLTKVKNAPENFKTTNTSQFAAPSADDENIYGNEEAVSDSIRRSVSPIRSNKLDIKSPNRDGNVPSQLNISREDLEKLCKNDEVINTLKSLLASRDKLNGVDIEKENVYGNDVKTVEPRAVPKFNPPPPHRGPKPIHFVNTPTPKKAQPPEHDDTEQIYEDPPEIPVGTYPQINVHSSSPLLPGRPGKIPPTFKSSPPPTPETDYEEPTIIQDARKQPRDKNPTTLTKTKLALPGSTLKEPQLQQPLKFSIRDTPLPPPPVANAQTQREITGNKLEDIFNRKLNSLPRPKDTKPPVREAKTLPRPPRLLPTIPNIPDLEETSVHDAIPECYRYTDRKGSEMLLAEDLGNGSYLLRPSRKFYCTLSLRYEKKIYHIGIKELSDGTLECESFSNNFHFESLKQITVYFKENPLTLIDGEKLHTVCLRDVLPADRT